MNSITHRLMRYMLLIVLISVFSAATKSNIQNKPFTGGPNNNGTASVFLATDGTQTPLSTLSVAANTTFTLRAYVDLRQLNGTDFNNQSTPVELSGLTLTLSYDPTIVQLVSPALPTGSTQCTNSSLNPIYSNATDPYEGCHSYTAGPKNGSTFAPNSYGLVVLSISNGSTGNPTGLVELPAFNFKTITQQYVSTVITLVPSGNVTTSLSASYYTGSDIAIPFSSTELVISPSN